MSLTVAEQRDVYPLANYAFRVVVDGVALRFTKVSGLSREYKLVTYRHGLSFQEGEQVTKVPAEGYTSLTLEQGTVLGSAALPAWLEQRTSSPLEVSLCDEKGVPVLVWTIAKAFAVKLAAPTLDARSNDVCIDTLEVKASGIAVKHLA
ncbi:MAG TPA: phage tail protein [Polyangiaceae bacterium]|nr:phage tail protein [Polyangiaceae bacterium]